MDLKAGMLVHKTTNPTELNDQIFDVTISHIIIIYYKAKTNNESCDYDSQHVQYNYRYKALYFNKI